jgi:hypothetical protein
MNKLEYLASLTTISMDEYPIKQCVHLPYCKGKHFSMKCDYIYSIKACQLQKFYKKYGPDYFNTKQEDTF